MSVSLTQPTIGSTDWGASVNTNWQLIQNALNSFQVGALSARPAATAANSGSLYYATDSSGGTLYQSDGASWHSVGVPLGGVITPTALSGNADDYNPTGLNSASIVRMSSSSSVNLTGIETRSGAPYNSNTNDGRLLFLLNVGANNIVLTKEDAGSVAQNRFAVIVDDTVQPNGVRLLQYDATAARWRVTAGGVSFNDAEGDPANVAGSASDGTSSFAARRDHVHTVGSGVITDVMVAAANKDGAAGTASMRTLGTGAQQACAGDDARLSDARTPTAHAATHKSGGSDPIKLDELAAPTDITTLNSTTSAHGLLKKLSNSASEFMDGAGNWDTVKDTDLSLSDVTTNDASTSQHGFLKKLNNDATKYMNGTGAWSSPVPSGTILPYGGDPSSPPSGYLYCNAAAVSRTTYADLFATIGTTYGSGDGSTTFNVPDLMGRSPLGSGTGSGLSARTRGTKDGVQSVTLQATESGTAVHGHTAPSTGSAGAHSHTIGAGFNYWIAYNASGSAYMGAGAYGPYTSNNSTSDPGNHQHTASVNNATAASAAAAHNNMHPFLVVGFIIKT